MARGRLIVLEGTDGSGKATQAALLTEALSKRRADVRQISFPRYGHPMAAPIEHFLAGSLWPDKESINPYGASILYAADRMASYAQEWGSFYQNGGIVIADRYTTSNAVHQSVRLQGSERQRYLRWLFDLEYNKLRLPCPDLVLYLHVNAANSNKILASRTGKGGVQHDILESDSAYLHQCKEAALATASSEGWVVINCNEENGQMRSIQAIHQTILVESMKVLEKLR